jgi:hypothetical protein
MYPYLSLAQQICHLWLTYCIYISAHIGSCPGATMWGKKEELVDYFISVQVTLEQFRDLLLVARILVCFYGAVGTDT